KAPAPVSLAQTSLFSLPARTSHIAPEKSFSVVAGDITMNGSDISGPGWRVNLVSVNSAGEAKLNATAKANAVIDLNNSIDAAQFTARGNIEIKNLARITTNPNTPQKAPLGGPVFIRGGTFLLDNSQINSTSFDFSGSQNAVSNIDVQAQDIRILAGARIA